MNTRTQKTIGKIFMQYTIAVALFAGLGVIDQVNAAEKPAKASIAQLFDSKAVADAKRFLAGQAEKFSSDELALAEQVDMTTYSLRDATTHLYAKNIRLESKDTQAVWPLLSLNVQNGDTNVKLGSHYQR